MTVGRPEEDPGGAEWSRQVFPLQSSSDTEAEEELPGDGLLLPRAAKLDEFLSPEEEIRSGSSDSIVSFCQTLQTLKQKGSWCLLESLYQSDPVTDENLSEDEEDLESFFQDKGREKPKVQNSQSSRFGSRRRCSSLRNLTSDSPRAQPSPPLISRPHSQHRSISSWASSITVPQPFHMMLREARKKAQWLTSPASFERERQQAQRQGQEEAECHRQFRAQPVPAHVYLPLYQEIMERNEARRRTGIEKRKELLLSSLKLFSFMEKEEQRKEAVQQRDLASTAQAKVPRQKATRNIPKSILEPAFGDKLQEAELLRKIRIQMRALEMLQMASSPIASVQSRADPQTRTATRTREEKLGFLQTDFGFQPRVNPAVPDYEGLYKAFQRKAAKRRETREATRNKPFQLRTASLRHTQHQGFPTATCHTHAKESFSEWPCFSVCQHPPCAHHRRHQEEGICNQDLARKEAERRYRDTLKQAGLDEDFVKNKCQGIYAIQWKESGIDDSPSIYETTKLNIREPPQDLEDSLGQPTSPKKELEELFYESPDTFK
ncbi:protein FAM161B isoform X3 [Tamandua tetradactyla]|uniref:protein FAM161B isoform X3 n=1 Tax=Tamandua tetradactyla TaxID=48850 RepID=UPI004053A5A3